MLAVTEADQHGLDFFKFAKRLAGGQAGELHETVAEKLVTLGPGGSGMHRNQPILTEVERDPEAAVERELLGQGLAIQPLNRNRGGQRPPSLAARVKRAVAKVLFEFQPPRRRQAVDLALEPEHAPERGVLDIGSRTSQHRNDLGELRDVVDHAEAVHLRVDHPRRHEVERPRGRGEE
jgi:hypothetical protein